MKKLSVLLFIVLLTALLTTSNAFANPYKTSQLTNNDEYNYLPVMNNNRQVAWFTQILNTSPVQHKLYLYDGNTIKTFATTDKLSVSQLFINNQGVVSWSAWATNPQNRVLKLYDGNNIIQYTDDTQYYQNYLTNDIGPVFSTNSKQGLYQYDVATGTTSTITNDTFIYFPDGNSRGDIVWRRSTGNDLALFDGNTITAIPNSQNAFSAVINENGVVAWVAPDGSGGYGAFIYDGTQTTQLSSGAQYTYQIAMNNLDQVVWVDRYYIDRRYSFERKIYDGNTVTTQFSSPSQIPYAYFTNQGYLVWIDTSNWPYDIYINDGTSSFNLTNNTLHEQTLYVNPNGDIVWGDQYSSTGNIHIAALNGNLPPIADAGAKLSAYTGDTLFLDGSGSYDPDGDIISGYRWNITLPDGTDGTALLSNPFSPSPSLLIDQEGIYDAELTVNDGISDSARHKASIINGPYLISTVGVDPSFGYDPEGPPKAFNDLGQAVWSSYDYGTNLSTTYFYDGNSLQTINVDSGSYRLKMNNSGHIAWLYYDLNINNEVLALYDGNTVTAMPSQGYNEFWYDNYHYSLNDQGHMAWVNSVPSSDPWMPYSRQVVMYDGSNVIQLTSDETTNFHRPTINNNGEIVWYDSNGNIYKYDGVTTQIIYSVASGQIGDLQFNDLGQIAWSGSENGLSGVFLLENGVSTHMPDSIPPDYYYNKFELNDAGQIMYHTSSSLMLYSEGNHKVITTEMVYNPDLNNYGEITYVKAIPLNPYEHSFRVFMNDGTTEIQVNIEEKDTDANQVPLINDNGEILWFNYPTGEYILAKPKYGRAPVASAGPDQTVNEGDLVILDGSASQINGGTAVYTWTQTTPPYVALDLTDPVHPTFVAPEVTATGAVLNFDLIVSDGTNSSVIDTVSITVNNVNKVPVAANDTATTNEDQSVVITASNNDYLGDQPAAITSMLNPLNGSVSTDGANIIYTPNLNFNGSDSFQYTLTDADGETSSANVTVTVLPVNDTPVAVDDLFNVDEGALLTAVQPGVLGNDSDVDGDALSVTMITSAVNGVVALNADGSFSYTHDGSETLTDAFTYQVSDGNGGVAQALVNITINPVNDVPVAHAGGPYSEVKGIALTFDGSLTSDAENDPLSYSWDFGDGTTGVGVNPVHSYATAGIYFATLTVNDGQLNSLSTSVMVEIVSNASQINQPPVANAGGPYNGAISITFDGSASTDPNGDFLTYLWDFGDGSTGTGVSPLHVYQNPGSYNVTVTVSDGQTTSTASSTATITVGNGTNAIPVAVINGTYSVPKGSAITLDGAASSDADGDPLTYLWDFGDGTVGTGAMPMHTYINAGIYTVTLIVNDGTVDSIPATTQVDVVNNGGQVNQQPVAVAGGPYTATLTATFDGSASFDPDNKDVLTYFWNFGDGTTGAGVNPSHTYQNPGVYTVTLQVNDGLLDSAPVQTQVTITVGNGTNQIPVANAGNDQAVWKGDTVILNGINSYDLDGTIVSYNWTQVAGPDVKLTAVSPTSVDFKTPNNLKDVTVFEFALVVIDNNNGASATDLVQVIVSP